MERDPAGGTRGDDRCGPVGRTGRVGRRSRWRSTSKKWSRGSYELDTRRHPPPRGDHRLRVRRPVRRQGAAPGTGPGHSDRSHQPSSVPTLALPGDHGDPLGGPDRPADPRRAASSSVAPGGPGRGGVHRSGGAHGHGHRAGRRPGHLLLRQPHRGRWRGDVLFRSRRFPRGRLRHEVPQRRPVPARGDLRGVRAGRAGGGRGPPSGPDDLRGDRGRAERRGDGRTAQGALPARPAAQLPAHRSPQDPRRPGRGGRSPPRHHGRARLTDDRPGPRPGWGSRSTWAPW